MRVLLTDATFEESVPMQAMRARRLDEPMS